ncbi:glycosyltransferase family 32 protein [Butyrivibrio sp. FCS014]|uniref:glycosyltransferase family 32 protein n=1 Tax=Butyrivibrio sp. FCS014 TaxID=1408304 RepID=UPI000467E554|nr:glycosyltransferase [Butyrivibrio sp. FCS014]
MKFVNCSYETFIESIVQKKVIQFGASSAWQYFLDLFPNIQNDIVDRTSAIVDNSAQKQGQSFKVLDREIEVKSPDVLPEQSDYVILITAILAHHEAICEQLLSMNLGDDVECYSLYLMAYSTGTVDNSAVDKYFADRKDKVIPAKIHSFWFSGEEKPDLYKRCIESWYKYCPEFEIIEWNTQNYDVSKNTYMAEAFEKRKWAFVSDFARLDVIHTYGGVYLDMDVELVAGLSPYLRADAFFCRQDDGMLDLGSGFGAQKGNKLIREMLESYKDRHYILPDGSVDKTAQPELMNPIIQRNGITRNHDSLVVGDILVLSNDYITTYSVEAAVNNARLGIHWHNGGWLDERDRKNINASMEAREPLIRKYFK